MRWNRDIVSCYTVANGSRKPAAPQDGFSKALKRTVEEVSMDYCHSVRHLPSQERDGTTVKQVPVHEGRQPVLSRLP